MSSNTSTEPPNAFITVSKIWFALIVLSIASSFFYIDQRSLWIDELFTVYFADPSQPDFASFLARASEDVHPPGYYWIVWLAGRFTNAEMTFVIRVISGIAAAFSVAVIYWSMPAWVGRSARMFTCTLTATSSLYFQYAQEGRSYALVWVLTALLIALAFRLTRAELSESAFFLSLVAFVFVGTASGLTHAYMIPLIGALMFMMLMLQPKWPRSAVIALSGLVILAINVAYIVWHTDKIVLDVSDTWFSPEASDLLSQTKRGFDSLIRSDPEKFFFVLLIVFGAIAIRRNRKLGWHFDLKTLYARDALLVLGTFFLSILFVVLITVFYVPSYSFRFYVVLAPFFWVFIGFVFEGLLRSLTPERCMTLVLIATVIFVALSGRILARQFPSNEPWRETAEFVRALPNCENATLPVVVYDTPVISESEAENFYGYYLPEVSPHAWLPFPAAAVPAYPEADSRAEMLVKDRISGADPCPLLLWGVFHTDTEEVLQVQKKLETRHPLPNGTTLRLQRFVLSGEPGLIMYTQRQRASFAHVLTVQRTE